MIKKIKIKDLNPKMRSTNKSYKNQKLTKCLDSKSIKKT